VFGDGFHDLWVVDQPVDHDLATGKFERLDGQLQTVVQAVDHAVQATAKIPTNGGH